MFEARVRLPIDAKASLRPSGEKAGSRSAAGPCVSCETFSVETSSKNRRSPGSNVPGLLARLDAKARTRPSGDHEYGRLTPGASGSRRTWEPSRFTRQISKSPFRLGRMRPSVHENAICDPSGDQTG